PDGRGTLEFLVGRWPVRSPAPHGHGIAHLRLDLPAGRISHALAALAADGAGGKGGTRLAGRGSGNRSFAGCDRDDHPGRTPGSAASGGLRGRGALAGTWHLARTPL